MDEVNDLLNKLALVVERNMQQIGLDPRNPAQVHSYVKGCQFSSTLEQIILEDLDKE